MLAILRKWYDNVVLFLFRWRKPPAVERGTELPPLDERPLLQSRDDDRAPAPAAREESPAPVEPPPSEPRVEDPDNCQGQAPPVAATPIYVLPPHRKEKWVTPRTADTPKKPARTVLHKPDEPRPWKPPTPKPPPLTDDPEKLGQYYFRDAILDQLDRYWVYLRRMKYGDEDNYNLLRQVGIQLVPWSATHAFDRWLNDASATVELSPWWRENRPGFGAIAYGFDDVSEMDDHLYVADSADPNEKIGTDVWGDVRARIKDEGILGARPVYITPSSYKATSTREKPGAIWTPRFLYFNKYEFPPPDFERVSGGDVYGMTVYWDRADRGVPKRWRAKNKGGVPQNYGVLVEHGTGRVRVLKLKMHERVTIKWAKGPYGGKCTEPTVFINTHWDVPDRYLSWCHRDRSQIEPEDYLRRLFIEAASMYEAASLGSMVRIAVSKRDLTATFGVEVKRMSHFFKDRDVSLTIKGARRPVLHIVRPHVRKDGAAVKMHFRGMREFTWAGYHVKVSIPGRDHFHMAEFDVGLRDFRGTKVPAGMVNSEKLGKHLVDNINKGLGGRAK